MPLINTNTLQELIDTVGLETTREIAEALRSTLDEFAAELPAMDAEQMGQRAHALKGSTSYLGTEDLYTSAVAADYAHKHGQPVAPLLEHVRDLIEPSMRALDEALAAMPDQD